MAVGEILSRTGATLTLSVRQPYREAEVKAESPFLAGIQIEVAALTLEMAEVTAEQEL